LLLGWLFKPYVHCFDDMLSSLDEESLDVVPSSKVMTTKNCGHGKTMQKPEKLRDHPKELIGPII